MGSLGIADQSARLRAMIRPIIYFELRRLHRKRTNQKQSFIFISMKMEAKASRQLSFPWYWKRKSAINFHFRGVGNESQPSTFISTESEAKVNRQLSFRWKLE
ncbi:hypothetical protein NC99_01380 [Sunxiuqinia dokdonensis]|uniref:Uncharacterized protein n=1 Tax=Sunxiuqinia dokdonensis TaxID=1409788 RepID=A0A0L8VF45_9BACT|nr:hypothetical protein NC99_01380 [Sunxiuqinia dokdonensis]